MAQASSVQREPSMEEILASIRRIIEDSDTVRKGANDGEPSGDSDAVDSAVIEVDAFRSELRAVRGSSEPENSSFEQPEMAQPEPAKPITLAEVQAQLNAEIVTTPQTARDEPVDAMAQPQISEPPAEMAAPEPEAKAWASQPDAEADTAVDTWAKAEQGYEAELESALEDLSVEQAAAPAVETAVPADARSDAGGFRPAIISEQAGRQVAAAFGELSEAFAARSRKTFDDMAEEMMRPMLQDWLDNNLPTLVERLVREEIERVARGA